MKIGRIELAELARDRDQLFAEAVEAFRAGAQWWPDTTFEREHIKPQQAARYDADAWQEPISKFVNGRERVSIAEVAFGALDIPTGKIGTEIQRRIAAVLIEAGWQSGKDWKGRFYSAPKP
jgi:predicted P-loop ATPase